MPYYTFDLVVGDEFRDQGTIILEDLRVLAVDQTASTDKTQPVVVRAVTLEMTPEEAEKLVKAKTEGQLQLALRNPLDNQKKPLAAEPVAMAAPPAPAPVAVPKPVVRRSSGPGGICIAASWRAARSSPSSRSA